MAKVFKSQSHMIKSQMQEKNESREPAKSVSKSRHKNLIKKIQRSSVQMSRMKAKKVRRIMGLAKDHPIVTLQTVIV